MNLMGEPANVGRHCGSNVYTVDERTVSFYQEALGDFHPLHERYAPPLIHHSECYAHLGQWYLKNLFGNLHGQQDWSMFAPIPIGSKVRTRSTIIDRHPKRGRYWVVNETDLMSAEPGDEGRLLVRGRTYQSFLPEKKDGEDGLVGDEKSAAKKLGCPNIVVQAMMSTCFVSQVMQDHFGMGWLEGGRMSVKLTNVLWVDETVRAHAKIRNEVTEGTKKRVVCDVWVEKTDGTRVILGEASAVTGD